MKEKNAEQKHEDEVLLRMLKTPPKPFTPKKDKASPKPPKPRIQRHQGR